MLLTIAAVAGALIGFASHDLASQALSDEALLPFRGSCPNCGTHRGWLVRTCPSCGRRIAREPFVALATAVVAGGFASTLDVSWLLVPYGGFLVLTTALALTDVDAMRIVDRLNLRGSAALIVSLGVASFAEGDLDSYLRAIGGGAAYFGGAFVLFVIARGRGFGAGDVKLAPVLGVFTAYLGWTILGRAVLATAIIGGLLAVIALIFSEAKRDTELPYGPAMILGAWAAIITVGISAI